MEFATVYMALNLVNIVLKLKLDMFYFMEFLFRYGMIYLSDAIYFIQISPDLDYGHLNL